MVVNTSDETLQRVLDREEGQVVPRGSLIDDLGDHEITIESNWDMVHYRVSGYIDESQDIFYVEIKAEDALGFVQFCLNYLGDGKWERDDSNQDPGKLEEILLRELESPQKKEREMVFCKVLIEKAIPLMHMMRKDLLGE